MYDAKALLAGDENALADAVYQLRVQGTTVSAIRSRIEQILDTVG